MAAAYNRGTDTLETGATMTTEFHPPVEEYLQTIQCLAETGTPVIQARLAERMGKSAPAVSEMLDRLAADGYLERSGRRIVLTESGRVIADSVLRKHRLAERLLVDVIGLPWHKAHNEAGRWEHVMSDDVETRLIDLLGDPATCPHGNPIPGSNNPPSDPAAQTSLANVPPGERVRLERVTEDLELDLAWLRYLDEGGFIPGSSGLVQDRTPDGAVVLDVDGHTLALGPEVCRQLFVAVGT
ncbi:MAG: metal-dependent transcriptional regulator [Acidimicrobiales bacterium]